MGTIWVVNICISNRGGRRDIFILLFNAKIARFAFTLRSAMVLMRESISENLTALRYGTLKAAKEKFGNGNVWSSHGRIITKIDNTFHSFTYMEELQRL